MCHWIWPADDNKQVGKKSAFLLCFSWEDFAGVKLCSWLGSLHPCWSLVVQLVNKVISAVIPVHFLNWGRGTVPLECFFGVLHRCANSRLKPCQPRTEWRSFFLRGILKICLILQFLLYLMSFWAIHHACFVSWTLHECMNREINVLKLCCLSLKV